MTDNRANDPRRREAYPRSNPTAGLWAAELLGLTVRAARDYSRAMMLRPRPVRTQSEQTARLDALRARMAHILGRAKRRGQDSQSR